MGGQWLLGSVMKAAAPSLAFRQTGSYIIIELFWNGTEGKMNFGFSYVGLVYLAMLMVPNLIWAAGNKPRDYGRYAGKENRALLAFERIGEALVSAIALVFSDFNPRPRDAWCLWLAASFILMLLYEAFWIRYFKSERTMRDFYRGFAGIPVAGATLPVAAFFLLGVYGRNIPMMLSTVILDRKSVV